MSERGFATPEEAARGDIPARYARALATAVSPDGRHAVVLLGTNEPPRLYPYEVICHQRDGLWFEGSSISGGGIGWTTISNDDERNVGVLRLVEEAPDDAVAVIVRHRGVEHRVPVRDGYFMFAVWDVPDEQVDTEQFETPRYVTADGREVTL